MDVTSDGAQLLGEDVHVDHEALLKDGFISPEHIRSASGGFLPGYSPMRAGTFADWFDAYRSRSISSLSRALLREASSARDRGEWMRTEHLARACLALDPLNEEATIALAEMLFLGGSKAAATQLLDHYMQEVGRIHPDLKEMARALQRRMDRTQETAGRRFGPRFVGRAEEMDRLRETMRRAALAGSQAVVLFGEPGIGKSRLVSEFRSIVELEGVRCQSVAMQPHDFNRPMGAFVDLVPGLLRLPGALGCSPESMEALRRLTKSASVVAPNAREHSELDAVAFSVTSAVIDICESIAAEAPLSLIIEDAHSLDQFSANMISALLASGRQSRLIIVITTREPRRLRNTLRSEDRVRWLPVMPLPTAAMELLIDDISEEPLSSEARSKMIEAANGNPLFALSLAKQHGRVPDGNGQPPTLVELLSKRLNPLSTAALSVLATCIALGKHCTTERLLRAIGIAPIALLDAFSELGELGLIDVHSDRATPAHPLIAEAVANHVMPSMRTIVSFRVAEVFENDARELCSPAYWWDAGSRWRDAGEAERALAAFRECARHAMEIGRPADAARILNEALELAAPDWPTLEAARELITAADLSSDTMLVLRGHSILKDAGIADQHDDIELAVRSAVLRESRLPDRVFEMTLGCLQATDASTEHRVLAAILGLKGVSVAQSGKRVARLIEEHVSPSDLDQVDDAVRLEFEMLTHAARDDWEAAAAVAGVLMRAAEGKLPGRQSALQLNSGIALNLGGNPGAAIDAWERAFRAADLAHSPSQQTRLAALIAGVYADLFDDERCDEWLAKAVEANSRATGFVDTFALPVMQLARSFALADGSLSAKLLSDANEQGVFCGSPVRQRWGRAYSLFAEARATAPSPEHEDAARVMAGNPERGICGVRDFEIATAARILGARDPREALDLIRRYLSNERVGRQLIDRQLAMTIRELEARQAILTSSTRP